MTTFEEMLALRPVDSERLNAQVQEMHANTHFYQLQQIRKNAGMTQTALAKKLGVSQHRISQIESGRITTTKVETIQKYLNALGSNVTISAVFPSGQSIPIFDGNEDEAQGYMAA